MNRKDLLNYDLSSIYDEDADDSLYDDFDSTEMNTKYLITAMYGQLKYEIKYDIINQGVDRKSRKLLMKKVKPFLEICVDSKIHPEKHNVEDVIEVIKRLINDEAKKFNIDYSISEEDSIWEKLKEIIDLDYFIYPNTLEDFKIFLIQDMIANNVSDHDINFLLTLVKPLFQNFPDDSNYKYEKFCSDIRRTILGVIRSACTIANIDYFINTNVETLIINGVRLQSTVGRLVGKTNIIDTYKNLLDDK